jgi:hypothetical protein
LKLNEWCNKCGITKEELTKLSGVPNDVLERYDCEKLHMMSAIYLFKLSLVLGLEDGKGYELIDDTLKQQAIKEVKANFIHELAKTEIEDCIAAEYVGEYECIYDFCVSKVEKDDYKKIIEYRYPMLLRIMSFSEVQEAVKDKIGKLLNDKWKMI